MDDNEKKIVRGLKDGKTEVFNDIFNSHYHDLCRYAYLFVKDELAAEEIVEECFFRLWQNRNKFKINISLKSYLLKTVHNISLNYLQHLNVIKNYKELQISIQENKEILYSEFESSPLQVLQYKEFEDTLNAVIDNLPTQQKKIFRMNRFQGKKYREIADELEISITTVKTHMSTALQYLREQLKDYF
jgi:RNA polymerase sigma-70 factor (ECF subfamily)